MAQRRSGRDEDDLSDVKALAAKARETGGPVSKLNPAELSGVRPRRDSVIGMRLTPPPRQAGGEMSNWLWGVLGCLSVLLVGFTGLFFLGRAGKLGPLLGQAAAMVGSPPAAPPAPAVAAAPAPAPIAAKEPEAPAPTEPTAPADRARPEHGAHSHASEPAPAEPAAPAAAEPAAAAPTAAAPTAGAEPAAPAAADNAAPADDSAPKRGVHGAKGKAGKEGDAPAGDDDSAGSDTPEAKARPARAAAPAAKAADDSDDDQSLPGQDDVERALDALAPRMRGCFVKYQIKGTARVRLVATPAGKAESVNVTGDFEDTPTGLCVESVLTDAKLPTFKGPSLKLSQSYQLR